MDYASSIQAVALRVSTLDTDGSPLAGTNTSFVTSQFSTFSWTPEYEIGDEINEKGADGSTCVYYKIPDVLKKVNVSLAICNPQPEITEILVGGSLLTASISKTVSNKALTSNVATLTSNAHGFLVGDIVTVSAVGSPFDGTFVLTAVTTNTLSYAKTNADVVSGAATGSILGPNHATSPTGWQAAATGAIATPNGVGVEVFTRAIVGGKPAAVNPFWNWVLPYGQFKMDGERVMNNGLMGNVFTAEILGNAAFAPGPQLDIGFSTSSAIQYDRVATAPTGINNYQTVV